MSLAPTTSTTHTDDGLFSRIFNFKSWRSADDEKPEEPFVPRLGYANIEIKNIALNAYNSYYTHNYVRISRSDSEEPRLRTKDEAARLDKIAFDSASENIRLILRSIVVSETDDHNIKNKLIDDASWALMRYASTGTSLASNLKDDCAAYVMEHLLFPLKNEMLFEHDRSLLYRALFQDKCVMGENVFKAVVSRNDQLLRQWEKHCGDAFDALGHLYKIQAVNKEKFVAKMPSYSRPPTKRRRLEY